MLVSEPKRQVVAFFCSVCICHCVQRSSGLQNDTTSWFQIAAYFTRGSIIVILL